MNQVLVDPDIKVNMSLDEIIHLTRSQIHSPFPNNSLKTIKKKKRHSRRRTESNVNDHSVPLLSSPRGVDIYVTKNSPLLNAENRRRIAQAFSNRVLNSDLLEKTKEIIPAHYKLIKTNNGVERVLVPAVDYFLKPSLTTSLTKKLSPPRKLSKPCEKSNFNNKKSLQDKPPPLVAAPIYKSDEAVQVDDIPMEVDGFDDDILILSNPGCKKMEVIDVESDSELNIKDTKELCVQALNSVSHTTVKTLNDRFSMLTGNLQF